MKFLKLFLFAIALFFIGNITSVHAALITIVKNGTGTGVITSVRPTLEGYVPDSFINCGSVCSEDISNFPLSLTQGSSPTRMITLYPKADNGSFFAGWDYPSGYTTTWINNMEETYETIQVSGINSSLSTNYESISNPIFNLNNIPTVACSNVENVTQNSATITCSNNRMGLDITKSGIVWGIRGISPTLASNIGKTTDGSTARGGGWTSNITGLTPNTSYGVSGYATNSMGTGYGGWWTFKTLPTPTFTVATGNPATDITQTNAWASVTTAGGIDALQAGIVWGTTEYPEVGTSLLVRNTAGLKSGTKSLEMTGLIANTTYYVRAYGNISLTDTTDTSYVYGSDVEFKTSAQGAILTVATGPVTAFAQTTATSSVTTGGVDALQAGIVWGTAKDPKVSADMSVRNTAGNKSGFKALEMTGLIANTTYHVRAYGNISATDTTDASYIYGADVEVTTSATGTLTVVTGPIASKTQTNAWTSVTTGGGVDALQAGIVWGTTLKPKVSSNMSVRNTGGWKSGTVPLEMTGLNAGTLYHVRAYGNISATDTTDTSYTYGDDVTFVTSAAINTGIWKDGTCPQCGYSGGEIDQLCTGGNYYCNYPAPTQTCPATSACPPSSCVKDGNQGPGETGIDCGGTLCPECKKPPMIIEI